MRLLRLIRRLKYGRFTAHTFNLIESRPHYSSKDRRALRKTLQEIANMPETSGIPPINMTNPKASSEGTT